MLNPSHIRHVSQPSDIPISLWLNIPSGISEEREEEDGERLVRSSRTRSKSTCPMLNQSDPSQGWGGTMDNMYMNLLKSCGEAKDQVSLNDPSEDSSYVVVNSEIMEEINKIKQSIKYLKHNTHSKLQQIKAESEREKGELEQFIELGSPLNTIMNALKYDLEEESKAYTEQTAEFGGVVRRDMNITNITPREGEYLEQIEKEAQKLRSTLIIECYNGMLGDKESKLYMKNIINDMTEHHLQVLDDVDKEMSGIKHRFQTENNQYQEIIKDNNLCIKSFQDQLDEYYVSELEYKKREKEMKIKYETLNVKLAVMEKENGEQIIMQEKMLDFSQKQLKEKSNDISSIQAKWKHEKCSHEKIIKELNEREVAFNEEIIYYESIVTQVKFELNDLKSNYEDLLVKYEKMCDVQEMGGDWGLPPQLIDEKDTSKDNEETEKEALSQIMERSNEENSSNCSGSPFASSDQVRSKSAADENGLEKKNNELLQQIKELLQTNEMHVQEKEGFIHNFTKIKEKCENYAKINEQNEALFLEWEKILVNVREEIIRLECVMSASRALSSMEEGSTVGRLQCEIESLEELVVVVQQKYEEKEEITGVHHQTEINKYKTIVVNLEKDYFGIIKGNIEIQKDKEKALAEVQRLKDKFQERELNTNINNIQNQENQGLKTRVCELEDELRRIEKFRVFELGRYEEQMNNALMLKEKLAINYENEIQSIRDLLKDQNMLITNYQQKRGETIYNLRPKVMIACTNINTISTQTDVDKTKILWNKEIKLREDLINKLKSEIEQENIINMNFKERVREMEGEIERHRNSIKEQNTKKYIYSEKEKKEEGHKLKSLKRDGINKECLMTNTPRTTSTNTPSSILNKEMINPKHRKYAQHTPPIQLIIHKIAQKIANIKHYHLHSAANLHKNMNNGRGKWVDIDQYIYEIIDKTEHEFESLGQEFMYILRDQKIYWNINNIYNFQINEADIRREEEGDMNKKGKELFQQNDLEVERRRLKEEIIRLKEISTLKTLNNIKEIMVLGIILLLLIIIGSPLLSVSD